MNHKYEFCTAAAQGRDTQKRLCLSRRNIVYGLISQETRDVGGKTYDVQLLPTAGMTD